MSIYHEIANCGNPNDRKYGTRPVLGRGCDRTAYYSRKYNCVIKKAHSGSNQSDNEKAIFEQIEQCDRIFFPYIGFIKDDNGDTAVLMRKIDSTIAEAHYCMNSLNCLCDDDRYEEVSKLAQQFKLDFDIKHFCDVISKYSLSDLHSSNIGIYQGRLVIIDLGISEQYKRCNYYNTYGYRGTYGYQSTQRGSFW